MSLHAEPVGPVPDETARVARVELPTGNVYMQMRDVLGAIYDDASLRSLFAVRGRPAESLWRLALVTVKQFAEAAQAAGFAGAAAGFAVGLAALPPFVFAAGADVGRAATVATGAEGGGCDCTAGAQPASTSKPSRSAESRTARITSE